MLDTNIRSLTLTYNLTFTINLETKLMKPSSYLPIEQIKSESLTNLSTITLKQSISRVMTKTETYILNRITLSMKEKPSTIDKDTLYPKERSTTRHIYVEKVLH